MVQFWDRITGRMAAPTLEIPGSQFTGLIRVAPNGQFATMSCQPYGVLVCDLRSFHGDPLQSLSPADVSLLAEINSSAKIENGQLSPIRDEEIDRWDEFRSRNPDFHRREIPPDLLIRDNETRAHEFNVLKMPAAAKFHRGAAKKVLGASRNSHHASSIGGIESGAK